MAFRKKQKPDKAPGRSTFSIFKDNINSSKGVKRIMQFLPSGHQIRFLRGQGRGQLCIEIFVDEECTEQNKPNKEREKSLVLHLRPGDGKSY
ncbi:non-specific serine/threonine protein kinase [Salvia divinorum]|uniref:Non-specific serine/threonine protein kinase n=1 Tax=Salvia divinorum TaxID=28513 RepID=A0ABD1FTN6_SALDI